MAQNIKYAGMLSFKVQFDLNFRKSPKLINAFESDNLKTIIYIGFFLFVANCNRFTI